MAEKKQRVNVDLPFEMVIEIVSRLPAKSVFRCKSVCKAWYNLIKTPNFIQKHRKDSPVITSILVTSFQEMYFKDEGFYKSINLESFFLTSEDWFLILGICNGLVILFCVQFPEGLIVINYIIGNPTTRDFRQIPSPRLLIMDEELLFSGFSSFLNDYKLVRVIYRISLNGEVIVKAEVYAMSTDTWVEINVRMRRVNNVQHLVVHGDYELRAEFQNGVFYWMAGSSSEARVVSFDISQGFYDEINVPTSIIDVKKDSWKIVNFKEEISLVIYNDDGKFEVWAVTANRNSWTYRLRVDNIPIVARSFHGVKSTITVHHYRSNSALLIVDFCGNDLKLLLYDLNSREMKTLPCDDVRVGLASDFYFYTESLLSVEALNEGTKE